MGCTGQAVSSRPENSELEEPGEQQPPVSVPMAVRVTRGVSADPSARSGGRDKGRSGDDFPLSLSLGLLYK